MNHSHIGLVRVKKVGLSQNYYSIIQHFRLSIMTRKTKMNYDTGQRFHCGDHKFSTDNSIEWRIHLAEEIHTKNGSAPCNYCGDITQFSYTGKIERLMEPAVCKNCEQLINQTIQSM